MATEPGVKSQSFILQKRDAPRKLLPDSSYQTGTEPSATDDRGDQSDSSLTLFPDKLTYNVHRAVLTAGAWAELAQVTVGDYTTR